MTLSAEPRALMLEESYLHPNATIARDETFSRQERGSDPPAVRTVEEMHDIAIRSGASDIHVEPTLKGGRIRQRVDGLLCDVREIPSELFGQVVARLKVLAAMDVADKRQPQDGRYFIERGSRSIDARVSSLPTIGGEKLVVRLLDLHKDVPTLSALGMDASILDVYREALHASHGFMVICGPTGSGKTTTAYASIAERNVPDQHVCTIEDPVEVRIPGVTQVQVNVRAGVTFGAALRSFLRADPNVIMVGEMRDSETAGVAISAALSGQLVLTTLHAGGAVQAVERLCEFGVRRAAIAAGLSAVVSQRLVRRLCFQCRRVKLADPQLTHLFDLRPGTIVYEAVGCALCAGSGYVGRTALFEIVSVTDELRNAIAKDASTAVIAEIAGRNGFLPMIGAGVRRVSQGETTCEELRRVVGQREVA